MLAGPDEPAAGRAEMNIAPRQEAWFGISDHDRALAEGPFAGVVFNRPIEQVLTYRVPGRLKRIIQPGQRVRVPLGRGDQPGRRLLRAGRRIALRRSRSGADQRRGRGARPAALDRRQDARADALDGGLLRVLLGPGARRRRAGGREEARRDADRNVPHGSRGDPSRLASGDPQAPAAAQAGRRAGGPLPERRAADGRRRLPPGQVHDRADPGASKAGAGAHGPPAAAGWTAGCRPSRRPTT